MEFSIEIKGSLEDVVKRIKTFLKDSKSLKTRIGVLKGNNTRDDGETNAEIGYYHEFGSQETNLPKRSWLRKPVYDGTANEKIESMELKDYFNNPIYLIADLSDAYLEAVKDEFYTWGQGEWKDLTKATWKQKKNKNILRETEQLFDSISWEYKK